MKPDLRIGLVGAGWAGGQHVASIAAIGGAKVVAVHDIDARSAATLAERLNAETSASLEALYSLEVDAVVVSTPSGVHREAMVPALENGIAVFVEKPVCRTSDDAWAIVEAAERTGTICAVGYQWRAIDSLTPIHRDLQQSRVAIVVSQGVGITQARSWFGDDRLSGGLIFERVSHHIDLHRMIAGEVASVSAVRGAVALSGRSAPTETKDDVLTLTLRFAGGAVGLIAVGWTDEKHPPTQSLTVHTTGTTFDVALDPDFTITDRSDATVVTTAAEPPFRRQIRSFLQAVRSKDQTLVHCSARDAAGTVDVALAAAASLAGNGDQQVVRHGNPTRQAPR